MQTESPSVFGADEQHDVEVDVPRWVRLARLVLESERVDERYGTDVEMSLLFVDEPTIAELNTRFLGGEGPTDVLAFPLDEELPPAGRQPDQGGRGPGAPSDPGEPPTLLGDVIVSPTVAGRQALDTGTYGHRVSERRTFHFRACGAGPGTFLPLRRSVGEPWHPADV